jgi:hypothetical protein
LITWGPRPLTWLKGSYYWGILGWKPDVAEEDIA